MRIHVINPNTTRSMTLKIGAAAKAAASPGVEVTAVNPEFGPASIEGYFDEAFSIPGLIEEIGKARDADAFVIACFDDTGLEAARCATSAPVIGIGEAAFHMASLIAAKFSVVTTLSRSIVPIEHNLAKYGLISRCARVRAAEVPVLALEEPGSDARRLIEQEIERALAEDGAEAIVLGCAGMTDLARDLARKAGVPVLDGVACAVSLAESLVRLGLKTSKRRTYAAPFAEDLHGRVQALRAGGLSFVCNSAQAAAGRICVAGDIGHPRSLGEAHERHPAIDVFVLARADEIGLVPNADVAARILHETIEFDPRRPVRLVARPRIGLEVIEAAPILNERQETEIRVAEEAMFGRRRLEFLQHFRHRAKSSAAIYAASTVC